MRRLRPPFAPNGLTWLALLLAFGHALIATWAMRDKSTTTDELAHITGGYTFNRWNDYRLHPENGILPQRWEALPTVFAGAKYPPMDSAAWRHSVVWLVGYDFFYKSGNDPDQLLARARAMNSLWGAATVLLVFFWARSLWGASGGLIAAAFAALCPTMLAHSGLATSDMCMTFFLLACSGIWWRHLHDGRWRLWWLSALMLGLAAAAKHSSVLLAPCFVALAMMRAWQGGPLRLGAKIFVTPAGRFGAIALSTALQGVVAMGVVWAFFGFRYSTFNPALPAGEFNIAWDFLLTIGGMKAWIIEVCRTWHLLPEGWLYGFATVLKHTEARGAFLDGDYSIYGWIEFFPKAFFYKTPPSLLVALAACIALLAARFRALPLAQWRIHIYRVAPLFVLFAIYWIFSLTSHLNIGHRHILPTYPVLYILTGALGWALVRSWDKTRRGGLLLAGGVTALLGWHTATAAGIHPHYLAYFSPVIGGPTQGYKHLADSSLDWGQDLPALRQWLAANRRPGEAVYLSYFGTDEPARHLSNFTIMSRLPNFSQPRPWYWCEPGLYALGATMLQHVYGQERGPWTLENERLYQQLRLNDTNFHQLVASSPGRPVDAGGFSAAEWTKAWTEFERLRFARLCHYLRARKPDAQPGYSILVYRLDQAEIDAALNGDLRQLAAAIERAAKSNP